MSHESSSKRSKVLRRSLAVPFVITATLVSAAAQAQPGPEAVEPTSAAPNVTLASFHHGPIHRPGPILNPPRPGPIFRPPVPINPPGPIFRPPVPILNPPGPIFRPPVPINPPFPGGGRV